MRPAELQRSEIESKAWLEFFSVPCVGAQKLLVIFAFLIPVRQERAGKVEPFPVPALRHHVNLSSNLLLINLFRLLWVRNVEHAAPSIAETIDKQRFVVG